MKPVADCNNLDDVRNAIDEIDSKIINLLGQRFHYVKETVRYKEKDKASIIAKERLETVIRSRRKLAEENGLNADIIEKIYRLLIEYFINEELNLIDKQKEV